MKKALLFLVIFLAPFFAPAQIIEKIHKMLTSSGDTLVVTDDFNGRNILHSYIDRIHNTKIVRSIQPEDKKGSISLETYILDKNEDNIKMIIVVDAILDNKKNIEQVKN